MCNSRKIINNRLKKDLAIVKIDDDSHYVLYNKMKFLNTWFLLISRTSGERDLDFKVSDETSHIPWIYILIFLL